MTNRKENRNIGVDLLRGASILYIVGFWHMFNYTKAVPEYDNFITYRIALIILGTFIFISGYFIGLDAIDTGKIGILSFYKRKLFRIYPLYLFSIVLYTLLSLSNISTSLKAAFLVSMISGPAPHTLWFITMLMLFYIAAPFIITASWNIPIRGFLTYCTLFVLFLSVCEYFFKMPDIRVLMYLPSFISGVVFAGIGARRASGRSKLLLFLIPFAAVIFSSLKTNHDLFDQLKHIPMILSISWLFFVISRKTVISSGITRGIIMLTSYSSYSMYLLHRPLYVILKKVYFPESPFLQVIYLVAVCLPLIIMISFIIQKSYDAANNAISCKFRE